MSRRIAFPFTLMAIAGLLAACSGLGGSPTAAPTLSATVVPAPTTAPTVGAAATSASAATAPASSATAAATAGSSAPESGAIHLNLVADGTQASYRVREQLASRDLPSDAVGVTTAVSGSVVINPDGTIVPDQSKFVVDLTGLTSDISMRDGFVQRNLLHTSQYPNAEFDLTSVSGLASPLPTSGALNFQATGNLTAHGVTKPATWAVTGQILSSTEMTGTATTSFTFEDYNISQPRVPTVLSVVDKITLELDFHLVKAS